MPLARERPASAGTVGGGDEYGHLGPVLIEFAALPVEDPRRAVLRDRLVEGYLPVVRHIASRYRDRGEPVDDLEQVGAMGLMGALERYEPQRGVNFLGYAVPTITGEMRRHFRDRTWSMRVPRALKDLQGPLRAATASLSDQLGRAPRPSEIAAHLGVDVEAVIEALRAQDAYSATSLDTPVGAQGGVLADSLGWVDAELEKVEYRNALRPLLARLPERERTILVLRFFGELTQTQIAAQMGMSQMHVSRLLARTLRQLRSGLDND